ncbi:MAG: response regulator [Elusimicrobiota bacterium]|nr:response regulator [Elusimicrobiota bacterium]
MFYLYLKGRGGNLARILAVDDESVMTDFYTELLSDAGYEVKTAPDATAAMELYYDFKPDLIVLDAEMPGGGGERVFRIARTVLGSEVPVIFVTGLPERVMDFALTHSNVRVYKKTVKNEELLAAIKEMLGA